MLISAVSLALALWHCPSDGLQSRHVLTGGRMSTVRREDTSYISKSLVRSCNLRFLSILARTNVCVFILNSNRNKGISLSLSPYANKRIYFNPRRVQAIDQANSSFSKSPKIKWMSFLALGTSVETSIALCTRSFPYIARRLKRYRRVSRVASERQTNLVGDFSDASAGSAGPTNSCQLLPACSLATTNSSDGPLE